MSYVADQLAAKLREIGPGQRFNILSAMLPVRTSVRQFGTTPSSPVNNSILGLPLQTILDEFEDHAQHRTPALTAWAGARGARGIDVFGACPLLNVTPGNEFSETWNQGQTAYPQVDPMWFALQSVRGGFAGAGLFGLNRYTRACKDGLFIAGGFKRLGQMPWVNNVEPIGDIQNTSPIQFFEVDGGPSGATNFSGQVVRTSAIAGDQSFTYGPNMFGFQQSGIQAVPAGSALNRCWSALSISGVTNAANFVGLTKVQNIQTPGTVSANAVDLTTANANALGSHRGIRFGYGPTLSGIALSGGVFEGVLITPGNSVNATYDELGGFYFGRRALSSADMQKLYYSPSASLTVWLSPWQNPTRAMGYIDQMSHRQIMKLIDGIAAGTIDPQFDAPSAVWDAVR